MLGAVFDETGSHVERLKLLLPMLSEAGFLGPEVVVPVEARMVLSASWALRRSA